MRRRSERKKSASPAPMPARRSRRSLKASENEKNEDDAVLEEKNESGELGQAAPAPEEIDAERESGSSEERTAASPVRKSRTRTTPKKRSGGVSYRDKGAINSIPEETENGSEADADAKLINSNSLQNEGEDNPPKPVRKKSDEAVTIKTGKDREAEDGQQPIRRREQMDKNSGDDDNHRGDKRSGGDANEAGMATAERTGQRNVEEEVKIPSPSISLTANKDEEHLKTSTDVLDIQTEDVDEREEATAPAAATGVTDEGTPKEERRGEREKKKHKETKQDDSLIKDSQSHKSDEHKENRIEGKTSDTTPADIQQEQDVAVPDLASDKRESASVQTQRSVRKRKWLTKKGNERSAPVLAISTDSLKNIIADVVQPVSLSDVQLESSSEEEGLVTSDHDSNDRSMTPELVRPTAPLDGSKAQRKERDSGVEDQQQKEKEKIANNSTPATPNASSKTSVAIAPAPSVTRSPSPARNTASHVLYITNLVRPFTVLQLKGLLARTGKIVEENGFWIDRIKSKCYVAYSTEDEAIETRHALHGVRWPVSNPKCLNVDFGSRADMDRAIQTSQDDVPKYAQENTRDNQQSSNAWSRLDATDKKPTRPVREWDVGKREPNDRDKISSDRRRGSRERLGSRSRDVERGSGTERLGQDRKRSRERERERERERGVRERDHVHGRSRSGSPAHKLKKKDEPPIRLLDDLFRKTKATPCIYWLPLTPEAIAEKEAFRQKRIEEHKQRQKDRELERQKEREREKERERQRDTRRNRSTERRRSRSRDRRRY
ncbi:apoptotic chromatin condensation inducer in the nucleus [Scaptodrosophila lebanonensis]|uniref:Apoptotic chromatin condensation inducer in the nucleus n=1 Tax=Drosophila lebanonensis TaxID=7225 RepID=A0A6J2TPJ8_DROLE|nr:apoptotic chromatin condensation inducer in the nucleus [Scaptodrosophila lebanonensis]